MSKVAFTPEQRNWQWWDDDAAEPTTSLASENAEPTLADTGIVRLRLDITETGGDTSSNTSISLEYSTDDSNWNAFGAAPAHWNYADGQATEGTTLTGIKLTGPTAQGEYHESGSNNSNYAAGTSTEIDIAIQQTASATSGQRYYFRAIISSSPVPLGSGDTHPFLTTYTAGATTYTKTTSLSGAVQEAGLTKTTSASGVLKKNDVLKTSSLSGAVQEEGLLKTSDLNALLQLIGITETTTLDASVQLADVTKTASANAVLKALGVERSISLSGELVVGRLDIVSTTPYGAAGFLYEITAKGAGTTYTKSTSLSTLIQQQNLLKLATLGAAIQKTITKTTSLESLLQSLESLDVDFNALIQVLNTLNTDMNSVLKKTGLTKEASLSGVLKALDNLLTASMDAGILQGDITLTTDMEALIQKLGTKDITLDAALLKNIELTTIFSAVLKAIGVEKTTQLNAYLSGAATKTASLNAILKALGVTKTTSLNAALQEAGLTKAADVNAVLQKIGITKTTLLTGVLKELDIQLALSLNAILEKAGITKTADLNAVLVGTGIEKTTSFSAIVKAAGLTKTADLAAYLQKLITATTSLNAVIQKTVELTAGMSARLQAEGLPLDFDALIQELGLTKTTSLSSALATRNTEVTSLTAILKGTDYSYTALEGCVLLAGLNNHTHFDACVLMQQIAQASFSGVLKKLDETKSTSFDSCLRELGLELTVDFSAIIGKTINITSNLSANIVPLGSFLTSTTPFGAAGEYYDIQIKGGNLINISLNAVLQKLFMVSTSLSGYLWDGSQAITSDMDAYIAGRHKSAWFNPDWFTSDWFNDNWFTALKAVAATLDACLQKQNGIRTTGMSARLIEYGLKYADMSAAIMKVIQLNAALGGAVQKENTLTAQLNAHLEKFNLLTASLNGVLIRLVTEGTLSVDFNGLLQKPLSLFLSLDASLVKHYAKTATMDAVVFLASLATTSLQAVLTALNIPVTTNLDVVINTLGYGQWVPENPTDNTWSPEGDAGHNWQEENSNSNSWNEET